MSWSERSGSLFDTQDARGRDHAFHSHHARTSMMWSVFVGRRVRAVGVAAASTPDRK